MHPAPPSARPRRRAGCGAFAALLALAGAAHGSDEPDLDDPRTAPATAVGLDALRLLHAERRADRKPPRLLPLATTRTREGRVWLGLSRDRRDGAESGDVKLEFVWVVPIGR